MLAVKLWGGLGNQMFQYAFGKYLETMKNEVVSYYTIPFGNISSCELTNFRVKLENTTVDELKKQLILPAGKLTYRIERKLVQKFPFLNPGLQVENTLRYSPQINTGAVLFDGYWQSYKYLTDISDLIVQEYKLRIDVSHTHGSLPPELSAPGSVSVHIRRGDYLTRQNRQIFALCDKSYYEKAFKKIREFVHDPLIFIFSNDIAWVKDEMRAFNGLNFSIVDNTGNNNSAIADFSMMSRCRHNIIANSSFSWWSAWLNPNPEKVIIAPKQWYKGRLNNTTTDLIPETWIRL